MLTTREAALRLGVSLRTVQLWVEASILPAAKTPGGHRRIPYSAVEALAVSMGLPPQTQALIDAENARAARGQHLSPEAANAPFVEPHRKRVLLVSSDPLWLEACGVALEVFESSISVCLADNGYVGLLHIGRQVPDLLVTNLELQGMDGIEMIRTLERTESMGALRVLALSALSHEQVVARGGLPAAVEVLAAPVSPDALAIRVGRWLLTRQTLKEPQDQHE